MSKHLIRLTALFLVPCLIMDPMIALAFTPVAAPSITATRSALLIQSLFQEEALAEQAIEAHSDFLGFLRSRKWLSVAVLAVGMLGWAWIEASPRAGVHGFTPLTVIIAFSISAFGILVGTVRSNFPKQLANPVLFQLIRERWEVDKFHLTLAKGIVVFGSARILPSNPAYTLGEDVGRELFKHKIPPRTGAGPSYMEAVLKGYQEARAEARAQKTPENAAQGVRILLPFEASVNAFVEVLLACDHFVMRKLGLYRNRYGAIAVPGGYGTLDELFEVWQRGRPLALLQPEEGPYQYYWTDIINGFEQAWKEADLEDQIPPRPLITSSPGAAIAHIKSAPARRWSTRPITVEKANEELSNGFLKLKADDRNIAFIGRPVKYSNEWRIAGALAEEQLHRGNPVRVGSRGPLLEAITHVVKSRALLKHLQGVLFVPPGQHLRAKEMQFGTKIITHEPSVHQILLTKRTDAYVFFPGGVGTMNRLFDVLQLMQTSKIERKPIILVGNAFWKRCMNPIFDRMLRPVPDVDVSGHPKIDPKTGQPVVIRLISLGDEKLFHFVDTVEEARRILNHVNGTFTPAAAKPVSTDAPLASASRNATDRTMPLLVDAGILAYGLTSGHWVSSLISVLSVSLVMIAVTWDEPSSKRLRHQLLKFNPALRSA